MHLGGGLAGERAEDAAGVLHESALERDRCGEEERVERWAVEALAHVRTGGDDQQWRSVGLRHEPGERCRPGLRALAATPDDGLVAPLAEFSDKPVQVGGPLGEHEAVPATS